MSLTLRTVTELSAALALAPALDAHAAEFEVQFSDEPFPVGATARFLEQHFEVPETLLLEALDEAGGILGLCLLGPLVDPLKGTAVPTVLVLHVASTWRHRGVARALIRAASDELSRRGVRGLSARVGHNDDALISMGERWGFVRHWELLLRD